MGIGNLFDLVKNKETIIVNNDSNRNDDYINDDNNCDDSKHTDNNNSEIPYTSMDEIDSGAVCMDKASDKT